MATRDKCNDKTKSGERCSRYAVKKGRCARHYELYIEQKHVQKTITITFSESVENHRGMQIIGDKGDKGYSIKDLKRFQKVFKAHGLGAKIYTLSECDSHDLPEAAILVIRDGVSAFSIDKHELMGELSALEWDAKAFMYGRVVNKNARHNLCFADFDQEPDYKEGKGTIINFDQVPLLEIIRSGLGEQLGKKAEGMFAEGNLYYDVKKCFIGYHGDTERRKVIALRLGASFMLHFRWHLQGELVDDAPKFSIQLDDGDMYVFSDLAVGWNWKKKTIYTLRHAANLDST
jgi:hypothetical protein